MNRYLERSLKLYDYIYKAHWTGEALVGPDPGVRFNQRIWRFPKSYFRFLSWKDDAYFLQCQGYWIRCNWMLYQLTQESRYQETAIRCTNSIAKSQTDEGYWEYPLPQWKRKVATVEGNYGAIGLLETYKHTKNQALLDGAVRWYQFLIDKICFQKYEDSLAINYFAYTDGRLVPNNATLTLEFFAELYESTEKKQYLKYAEEMIRFLAYAQRENGELPYAYKTPFIEGREHFLCYQYNAFQFIDLIRYWEITHDASIVKILKNLFEYLKTGQDMDGHSFYQCQKVYPEVTYYTAVLAAAYLKARSNGIGIYRIGEELAYQRLLSLQNSKGGFIYSSRNYGILWDKRSYPRYLSMILRHLLMKVEDIKEDKSKHPK